MKKYKTAKQKAGTPIESSPGLCDVDQGTLYDVSTKKESGLFDKVIAYLFLGVPSATILIGGFERLFSDRPKIVTGNGMTFAIIVLIGIVVYCLFPGMAKISRDTMGGK